MSQTQQTVKMQQHIMLCRLKWRSQTEWNRALTKPLLHHQSHLFAHVSTASERYKVNPLIFSEGRATKRTQQNVNSVHKQASTCPYRTDMDFAMEGPQSASAEIRTWKQSSSLKPPFPVIVMSQKPKYTKTPYGQMSVDTWPSHSCAL